jgi:hypothetical protein
MGVVGPIQTVATIDWVMFRVFANQDTSPLPHLIEMGKTVKVKNSNFFNYYKTVIHFEIQLTLL